MALVHELGNLVSLELREEVEGWKDVDDAIRVGERKNGEFYEGLAGPGTHRDVRFGFAACHAVGESVEGLALAFP